MNCKALLSVDDEKGDILDCLSADRHEDSDRSSMRISRSGNKTSISIEATDAVSLRAAVNSMTKLLAVYEKTLGI